ncbi:MAG: TOMM precursor leader peptide-binding protein [Proteobacteria bacterium]|nr:TOMM precursor leader peptide-binding protein [Pseudomonadota bacterium]
MKALQRRPRWTHHLRCTFVSNEGIFLVGEEQSYFLQGPAYFQLAPLLDGQHTEAEIIGKLRARFPLTEIVYALESLRRDGFVSDAAVDVPAAQSAYWGALGVQVDTATRRLQAAAVSVITLGPLDGGPLRTLLQSLGVNVEDGGEYRVVLTDDYLRADLVELNRHALDSGRPWMLAKPVGTTLWLGPVFSPGQTGCWSCLSHRIRGQRKVETYLAHNAASCDVIVSTAPALPSTLQAAHGLIATEVVKWIVLGDDRALLGRVMSWDSVSFGHHIHELVKRPQCPDCGSPNLVASNQKKPIALQYRGDPGAPSGKSGEARGSEYDTFHKLAHHISPITGIVGNLYRLPIDDGLDEPAASYTADHSFALVGEALRFTRESLRGRASGKGASDMAAKTSALCESIERYSGVFQGDEARVTSAFGALEGAIHPNDCLLFSDRQIAQRGQGQQPGWLHTWVATPFDENQKIDWSPVWSLTHQRWRHVPTAYCYYGYSRQHDAWFARADSNGCAAGASREQAILHAFMELLERDSVALWWYNRLSRPAVDIASFDDHVLTSLVRFYRELHLDFWVLDITGDFGIPTFAAIARRNDCSEEDITFGFGSHFCPDIALRRAATEMNQLLPHVFRKNRYRQFHDPCAMDWWATATLETEPYLRPSSTVRPRSRSDYRHTWAEDCQDGLLTCIQLARDKGLEILVLDQTRPDTGLSVVKVIIPGLRHFWPRFAPGRLYDVPVEMGWLKRPLSEHELNNRHLFI